MSLFVEDPEGGIEIAVNSDVEQRRTRISPIESLDHLLEAHRTNQSLYICVRKKYLQPGEALHKAEDPNWCESVRPITHNRQFDRVQCHYAETNLRELVEAGSGRLGFDSVYLGEE